MAFRALIRQDAAVAIDSDDIGGVVTSSNGPEAGVWVIAETLDLPVRYIKAVVTDDRGRYVVPDLPQSNYNVWVRGYGLVDSAKVTSAPGKLVNLSATPAPNEAAAAEYYPAIYWYSMLHIPTKDEFSEDGKIRRPLPNGVAQPDEEQRLRRLHQAGSRITRAHSRSLGEFPSSAQAWIRRTMAGQFRRTDEGQLLSLGPWDTSTSASGRYRIAKGELPRPSRRGRKASNATLSSPSARWR